MGLLSNTKWIGLSQGFKILVQLLSMVVLARLIPPDEYGLMAMALVVVNLAMLIRDLGTSAAIIQRKELLDKTINAIFWLNVFMGGIVCLFVVVTSPVVAFLFHQEKLILVLCLISLSFPLGSSSATHLALLERQSKFRKVALIEVSSSLVSFIAAVSMALMGYGVLSLVIQILVLNLLSTIQLWHASDWRPSLKKIWDINELKNIFGFSANLTFFNFINYFSRNVDSMIIGHYMSANILGAYSLAYRVMLFPLQSLTFVASRALFPILSQYQDDPEKTRKVYSDVIYYILIIVMPLMLGVAVLSKEFVLIVFGDKWMLTSDILIWLAPTAIIQSVLSTSGTIFMSKGRTDTLMLLGVIGAILQVSAFLIGVKFGIIIFAQLYFLANVINLFPVMFFVFRLTGLSSLLVLKKIAPIFISSVGVFIVVSYVKFYSSISFTMFYSFILSVLSGIIAYAVMIIILDKQLRSIMLKVFQR
ncbi:lipopolysaccharide biosynthesis protein [Brenneria alni]|uniref:Lipopolysaccharide biosynthesis protein n=1 Tax=Brenneria alni TaxID=71656 RepID=A0A421DJ50_9GAMM|nr:lipopolysaccharide biosynthesis protein [Brenneria alni]RLM18274.1 lipopolysaccharide biosynthesis protein [Brenneria alni]